ncbi:MAG: hypothetical protein ACD_38C00062G0004 [uncultured bacterium]|uniref:Uncharacterized protein n=1 Tax=Candidatus Daviesbacteria bacterium GW2011_GWC2_40_12 TaxID=1618431 RepID=A0A0G0QN19_9BACT|nr:MAG: hypothetical protein ACD_38C00062G0004 [uncultured bacterium]KKR15945.1 MAG: hypothetical protein UT45_C0011G0028 [Candidatus Daviesbacteria bacterium GW2011_GWA2_39_33]KKR41553.1 MAG: hypothetical protein UT77_C0009G0011 [Candidatus Daviesbacteria bacterium GW2011_GWC2_40_12]
MVAEIKLETFSKSIPSQQSPDQTEEVITVYEAGTGKLMGQYRNAGKI